jgi:sirohydrochlorin cobaltochelatase
MTSVPPGVRGERTRRDRPSRAYRIIEARTMPRRPPRRAPSDGRRPPGTAAPAGDAAALLLAPPGDGSAAQLAALAGRLAARLGQPVRACPLGDPEGALAAAVERAAAAGAARLVVLPLVPGPEAEVARLLGALLASIGRRCPGLALRPAAPPDADDVARILGDRARQALARLPGPAGQRGDVAVVLAGAGANPSANAELARLARLVFEAHRFGEVGCAFTEATAPTVADAVARWARLGARRVVVVPHRVFAGPAVRRLAAGARAAAAAARVALAVARPLHPHPLLVSALVRRHVEALLGPEVVRQLGHAHAHDGLSLADLERRMLGLLPPRYQADGAAASAAPMAGADLTLDGTGRVAWDRMWEGFCELALAGGPPHRGSLLEPASREAVAADPAGYAAVREELARGIRLTTGRPVVLDGPPGWIGVACESEAMAIWLMRAIVVENVLARREGAVLYLPAGPGFTVEAEIRNVVTAVAKTHHYWVQHA